jgi:3-hydroxybutyryl-CoA dehydrogenase
METMYAEFRDPRHAPRPAVRQLLAADYRGRKSGRGFYTYERPNAPATTDEGAVARPTVDPEAVAAWRTVGVVGSGTMAAGIVEVCARAGFDVLVRARSDAKCGALVAAVGRSLAKGMERGKLDGQEAEAASERVRAVTDLQALAECDLVVEAVAEDLAVKQELFTRLDEVAKPDALLATTTSSLPVIACAMATGRPERVIGIHFFNPAAVMRLVELVTTVRTGEEAIAQARAFAEVAGKHAVLCGDRAGFIVNALLFPYLNDAVKMLEEGYATVAEIDTAMKLGCGHPMGPFELIDVVGLDVTLDICRALHTEFREAGYDPAPLLSYMVSAGYLGRKAGRGFYVYG